MEAGLHPATGGDGLYACSGDMLLEALVACAGVTLGAVATSIGVELRDATVTAEGDLDFRGTLGVSKEVPVGFERIRLGFELTTDASEERLDALIRLTERYCVVYQTLPAISGDQRRAADDPLIAWPSAEGLDGSRKALAFDANELPGVLGAPKVHLHRHRPQGACAGSIARIDTSSSCAAAIPEGAGTRSSPRSPATRSASILPFRC